MDEDADISLYGFPDLKKYGLVKMKDVLNMPLHIFDTILPKRLSKEVKAMLKRFGKV